MMCLCGGQAMAKVSLLYAFGLETDDDFSPLIASKSLQPRIAALFRIRSFLI
jgi:hypothetical protein